VTGVSKPVVAIVDPYTSSAMLAPAFREAGFSPVAVMNYVGPDLAPLHSSHVPQNYDAIVNHHGDVDATTERLSHFKPIAVIPGVEASLRVAEHLAQQLTPDKTSVPELVDARRHKYQMHQALAAAGLPIARQFCTSDENEAAAWIEKSGMTGRDLVIKPTMSAGTIGVGLAARGENWRELFRSLLGSTDKLGVHHEDVLLQEHLTGTEYVVDTISYDGNHTITDMLKYRRVRFGDGMSVYDSVEWLPYDTDEYGDLINYGLGALDAVGLRFWGAHTEIMMTPDGPRLLEINARLAGAGNPAVTAIATGGGQVTRLVQAVATAGRDMPKGYTLQRSVMAVFLMAHSTGVVRNAEVFDKARGLASYHSPVHLVSTGDHVEASTDLFASMQMGYIILAHDKPEQVYADREAIRELEKELIISPAGR
jgi:biotin carboxylase